MDTEQVDSPADRILGAARDEASQRQQSTAAVADAIQRIYTGLATLVGAGLGYTWSQHFFAGEVLRIVLAVVCGLIAAWAWPPTRYMSRHMSGNASRRKR